MATSQQGLERDTQVRSGRATENVSWAGSYNLVTGTDTDTDPAQGEGDNRSRQRTGGADLGAA